MTYPLMPGEHYDIEDWTDPDVDAWDEDVQCDGNGCIARADGMHHDKINGPHYWCTECPGCSRCERS